MVASPWSPKDFHCLFSRSTVFYCKHFNIKDLLYVHFGKFPIILVVISLPTANWRLFCKLSVHKFYELKIKSHWPLYFLSQILLLYMLLHLFFSSKHFAKNFFFKRIIPCWSDDHASESREPPINRDSQKLKILKAFSLYSIKGNLVLKVFNAN